MTKRKSAKAGKQKKQIKQQQPKRKQQQQTSVGEKVGATIGKFVERGARGLFRQITGLGDYKIASNTIVSNADPPIITNGKRTNLIRHREFIADVTGSVGYANTLYPVNPGNLSSFPWLSSLAANYEQYVFHGLVYEFKSTSADALNSTNTALGTVIMSTEYNVNNPLFTSKLQMENYEFTTSCKPSECMLHPIECDTTQTPTRVFYTRPVQGLLTNDLRFVDMGNFQIATVGMQAVATIGELWATFEVELIKPRLFSAVASVGGSGMWSMSAVSPATVFNNHTPLLSNAIAWDSSMTFSGTTLTIANNIIWPVTSRWIIVYSLNGGAVTPVTTVLTYVGANSVSTWDNGAGPTPTHTSTAVGSSDVFACILDSFQVTASPFTITWNGGTYPSANGASLFLCRYV